MKVKKFLNVFLLLSFCLCTSGCRKLGPGSSERPDLYEYVEFVTAYTEEEHIVRIAELTEEIFAEEIQNGDVLDYHVEILYAFDGDPEFFLVELEYVGKEYQGYYCMDSCVEKEKRYRHYVGAICDDTYVTLLGWHTRSGYTVKALEDDKKYYSGFYGYQCVERNGEMLIIATDQCFESDGCIDCHVHEGTCMIGVTIPEEEYEKHLIERLFYSGPLYSVEHRDRVKNLLGRYCKRDSVTDDWWRNYNVQTGERIL